MNRLFFLLFFLSLIACTNDNKPAPSEPQPSPQPTEDSMVDELPVADDQAITGTTDDEQIRAFEKQKLKGYQNLLSGEWQLLTDINSFIKIEGENIKTLNEGKVVSDDTYKLHLDCSTVEACKINNADPVTWSCFTTPNNCFKIRQINSKELHMQKAGETTILKYIKI